MIRGTIVALFTLLGMVISQPGEGEAVEPQTWKQRFTAWLERWVHPVSNRKTESQEADETRTYFKELGDDKPRPRPRSAHGKGAHRRLYNGPDAGPAEGTPPPAATELPAFQPELGPQQILARGLNAPWDPAPRPGYGRPYEDVPQPLASTKCHNGRDCLNNCLGECVIQCRACGRLAGDWALDPCPSCLDALPEPVPAPEETGPDPAYAERGVWQPGDPDDPPTMVRGLRLDLARDLDPYLRGLPRYGDDKG